MTAETNISPALSTNAESTNHVLQDNDDNVMH